MNNAERKITKIGNSFGVTIPNELLKQAGLKHGDDIQLELKDGEIKISKSRMVALPEGISDDFFDVLNETVSDYDRTIKGLVKR
ncbi:AbrB/MazE/SpoVT family DNA-binding domain-containing protein [Desulfuribacillus alkaliarsenatis]|uniref:AbrB family transcriptional regulator n=1 Tax=Desulfuribacillus alkaliarsenatis TaxID=766136 RepID=A0A1E5G1Q8_9FIRM|nr:AbrB/MazE/SpoVT family DNA-binding domain-containing protein [Desulfuribacillus alkaliarsenatis]OEF96849.1 AbrB family transcriptional regulator [Desulfuribacillus alkaliarsenatis]